MTRKGLTIDAAVAYAPSGLAGSVAASRYVGATASGAPTTGAHLVGDWVIDQTAKIWVCTVAATPGTWVQVGGGVTLATTVQSGTAFGTASAVGTSGNVAREDHQHGTPATPATSVAGRTGAVTLTAADIGAGTFPAGTFNFSGTLQEGGNRVYSAGNAPPYPVTSVAGRSGAVTLTAADIGAGTFPGANSYSGLQTMNAGLTIPSGQPLTVGTKKTFSGTLTTGVGNTSTALGQFSSTFGAISLRIHLHAWSGSAVRTKTYEFVVDTSTDTTNTYYKVLPADQSTAQSASNDVFLVCERPSTATTTWNFWVCTVPTMTTAMNVAWSVESYGDAVVTYSSGVGGAAAPTLPFAGGLHPSNSLDTVAGNVGIGTDLPTWTLTVQSATSAIIALGSTSSTGHALVEFGAAGVTSSTGGLVGEVGTTGNTFTDSIAGDTVLAGRSSSAALRLGMSGSASVLRLTSTDAQINDNGTVRSIPRGLMHQVALTANSAMTGVTTLTTIVGSVSTDNGGAVASSNLAVTFPAVNGRHYLVLYSAGLFSSVAGDAAGIDAVLTAGTGTLVGSFVTNTPLPAANTVYGQHTTSVFYAGATGNVTIAAQIKRLSGTGNVNAALGTSLTVIDLGG